MIQSIAFCTLLFGATLAQQQAQAKEGLTEPAPAESSLHGRYRSSSYGGSGYGSQIDPRYFDRGDTPHFGLAGFPFGYERRYYGQNVVYDNSLAGFPLNYYNYQQDYNNYGGAGAGSSYGSSSGYKGAGSSYSKPQYRSSAAYSLPPKSYGSNYPSMEYGAYLGNSKPSSGYYSLQYGY